MDRTARALPASLLLLAALRSLPAQAEEGGSGHYAPGAIASFIDALPGRTGLALATAFVYYPASASVRLPIAGSATTTLDSKVYANSLLAIYQTPLEVLGGNYAFGGAFAGIWMDLNGTVVTASGTRAASESASGIADVFLYPLMVGWTALGGDLKYDVRLRIYVPLGKYEAGSLANPGRNYWTFEPMLGVSFLSSQIGLEASAFTGLDFNTGFDRPASTFRCCPASSAWARPRSTTSRLPATRARARPWAISRRERWVSARSRRTRGRSAAPTAPSR